MKKRRFVRSSKLIRRGARDTQFHSTEMAECRLYVYWNIRAFPSIPAAAGESRVNARSDRISFLSLLSLSLMFGSYRSVYETAYRTYACDFTSMYPTRDSVEEVRLSRMRPRNSSRRRRERERERSIYATMSTTFVVGKNAA